MHDIEILGLAPAPRCLDTFGYDAMGNQTAGNGAGGFFILTGFPVP
jgi:hypothetical protein